MEVCENTGEFFCSNVIKKMIPLCHSMKTIVDLLNAVGKEGYKKFGFIENILIVQKLWGEGKNNPDKFKDNPIFKKCLEVNMEEYNLELSLNPVVKLYEDKEITKVYCTLDEVFWINKFPFG